jgi:hypothetical protein
MRYHQQAQALQKTSSSLVFEGECTTIDCGLKLVELKQRTATLYSCIDLVGGASDVQAPPVLVETMTSGEEALSHLVQSPMSALGKVLQSADIFPLYDDLGQCKFEPPNLNPEGFMSSSSPSDEARKQLFGADCNATASEMYIHRLPGLARKAVEGTLAHVKRLIRWKEAGGVSSEDELAVSVNATAREMMQKHLEEFATEAKKELAYSEADIAHLKVGSDLTGKDESGSAPVASALIEADSNRPEWTKNWKLILLIALISFFVIIILIIFLIGLCVGMSWTCIAWPFMGIAAVFEGGMTFGGSLAR